MHPLTPVLRGWKVFAAAVAIAAQQAYSNVGLGWLLLWIAASIPLGVAYGWLSWWNTHFRVGDDDLLLETGVFAKRSRRVRLDRLQAVDVVRPFIARLLGLAELRLEVAGGSSSEAPLAYLSEGAAQRLRAELLARAAGLDHQTPEAPEAVLLEVPLGRLVEAAVRSSALIVGVSLLVLLGGLSLALREWSIMGVALPALGVLTVAVRGVVAHFGFTVAESPDGLRLRHGLLETRSQTVPPGRVQAVRLTEPLLWRSRGWCRLEVDVAGYVGSGQEHVSVLCPVVHREDAMRLLARVLPGVDVDAITLAGVPGGARWVDPVGWRALGVGADEQVLVSKHGRFTRVTDVVLHDKVQSVRLTQGPIQRRLGLASLHLDTTPGPVRATAAHRDAGGARALLDAEVVRARVARARAVPDRWMIPPSRPATPTVTP